MGCRQRSAVSKGGVSGISMCGHGAGNRIYHYLKQFEIPSGKIRFFKQDKYNKKWVEL